uniref:Uncharacterized protein n=1 Tax=Chloracidobacterium thermophilum TaxID=458033 RepID=A8DJS3_9BACT|nr:hypothetical protein YS_M60-F11.166 [Chloracidobacterium thermophilum]
MRDVTVAASLAKIGRRLRVVAVATNLTDSMTHAPVYQK